MVASGAMMLFCVSISWEQNTASKAQSNVNFWLHPKQPQKGYPKNGI